MKISTKGRYGLRALVYIGLKNETRVSLKEISEKEEISLKYLEQIFSTLKKANVVESIKGTQGGYNISKRGLEFTIYEIMTVLEGDRKISDDNESSGKEIEYTINNMLWEKIDMSTRAILEAFTLEGLIEQHKSIHSGMFYI